MIGIPQYDLRLHIPHQLLLGNGLDTTHGAHGHKDRRLDLPVIGQYPSRPGSALRIPSHQIKLQCCHKLNGRNLRESPYQPFFYAHISENTYFRVCAAHQAGAGQYINI